MKTSPPIVFGRHVLPSAALSAVPNCALGTASLAMDVGCGGGFPGLPLAIIYPDTEFWLVDSVGKKLKAVQEHSEKARLTYQRRATAEAAFLASSSGTEAAALPAGAFLTPPTPRPGAGSDRPAWLPRK